MSSWSSHALDRIACSALPGTSRLALRLNVSLITFEVLCCNVTVTVTRMSLLSEHRMSLLSLISNMACAKLNIYLFDDIKMATNPRETCRRRRGAATCYVLGADRLREQRPRAS